jgi:hypothetical protein
MRVLRVLYPFLAAFVLLCAAGGQARAGDLHQVGDYTNNGIEAEIATYSDNGTVVAVLAFKTSSMTVSFAFDRTDWPALERLWQSAYQQSSTDFVSFGSLAETGTKAKCAITAAGGPMIRLTIVDPVAGALVFDVTPGVKADFDTKLRQAAAVTTVS